MKKNTLIVAGIVAAAIILMVVMVAGINQPGHLPGGTDKRGGGTNQRGREAAG